MPIDPHSYIGNILTVRLFYFIIEADSPGGTQDLEGKVEKLYELIVLVLPLVDEQGLQSWLTGMNPYFNDNAPAKLLRENFFEHYEEIREQAISQLV